MPQHTTLDQHISQRKETGTILIWEQAEHGIGVSNDLVTDHRLFVQVYPWLERRTLSQAMSSDS